MNILLYELKSNFKKSLIWILTILTILILLMVAIYPIYLDASTDIMKLLENYPEEVLIALGIDVLNFFSFSGFYNFSYLYLVLLSSIMASSLGIAVFGNEKKNNCSDFIFTKPISRQKIFGIKFLACSIIILISSILYSLTLILIYIIFESDAEMVKMIICGFGMYFSMMMFLSVGVVVSVLIKKIRSVSVISSVIGFIGFILYAVVGSLKNENLNFLSPFKYFEPNKIFINGGFDVLLILISLFIFIGCNCVAFYKYCYKDIHAV